MAQRFWIIGLVACALCAQVAAQVELLQSAGSSGRDGGHGWLVVPRDGDRFMLFHLPPRVATAAGIGDAVPSGTLRVVRPLAREPVAMAAIGNELVLLYPPSQEAGSKRWPVRSVRAVAGSHGLYSYVPDRSAGGYAVRPSLVTSGEVVDAKGALQRVFVLTEEQINGRVERTLLSFTDAGWMEHTLPGGLSLGDRASDALRWEFLEGSSTHLVIGTAGERPWRGSFADDAATTLVWEQSPAPLPPAESTSDQLLWLGTTPGRVRIAGDRLEVDRLHDGGWAPLARVPVDHARLGVVPLCRGGRLVVLGWSPQEARQESVPISEVSMWTGRTLYEGEASTRGPVSSDDFRMMALLMLALSVGVMIFLVRQPGGTEAHLPPGYALAAPSVRAAATIADWLLVSAIVAMAMGTPLFSTASVIGLLTDPSIDASLGLEVLVLTLLTAWLWSTVSEAMIGASPGKWMMGLKVISVEGSQADGGSSESTSSESVVSGEASARRPGLAASALRNAFKWGLLPWAAAEAMTPGVRHRGDLAARSAVVVELEPHEDDEPGAGD